MSIEELLKPRYKVIADYPESDTPVGTILFQHVFDTGNYIYTDNKHFLLLGHNVKKVHAENHPHLFKKLEWWEERKESEMPEYVHVNTSRPKKIIRISKWRIGKNIDNEVEIWADFNKKSHLMLMWAYTPATEEEYIQYQQNKNVCQ